MTRPRRTALSAVPYEPEQVTRLARYRRAYPLAVIGTDEYKHWEVRIRDGDQETSFVRHTLREALDRLGELLGEPGTGGGRG